MSESFAVVAAKIRKQGAGELAPELALDLLLNELVEEVRAATLASGAAIALWRGDSMVCRASAGSTAPDLGVPLATHQGLSGICVQSRQMQICTDVVGDTRVDEDASRQLGVRSIVVYPILAESELLGILEVFSARPHAFGERDIQIVRGLSHRIVENVLQSRRVASAEAEKIEGQEHIPEDAPILAAPPEASLPTQRDYLTPILILLIVGVAIFLGWVLGRAGWLKSIGVPVGPVTSIATPRAVADSPSNPRTSGAQIAMKVPAEAAGQHNMAGPDSATATSQKRPVTPGGLTIYQDGKVIFHQAPSSPPPASSQNNGEASPARLLQLAPEIANSYVDRRVEPQYPEAAREQHIQGAVTVDAVVDRQGVVQKVSPVDGPPQLISAAMSAVRQWHFHPFQPKGIPQEFETRITVKFVLPR